MRLSPIACEAPGNEHPFTLDMALSIAARGKIYKAKRGGEKIPTNWALDAEGRQTEDPSKALEGIVKSMGGSNGSAFAIMMDIFSGVLSDSASADHATSPYDPSRQAGVNHFLVAIKPDLFMSMDGSKGSMEYLCQCVISSDKTAGFDRIYMPAKLEQLVQEERA